MEEEEDNPQEGVGAQPLVALEDRPQEGLDQVQLPLDRATKPGFATIEALRRGRARSLQHARVQSCVDSP